MRYPCGDARGDQNLWFSLPWHYFFAKNGTRYTIWTWFLTLKSWPTLSAWIWLTSAHFDLFLHQNIFENIFHDRQSVLIFLLDAWRFFHELVLISSKKWMQPDLSCGSLIFLFHTRVDHTLIFFMQEEIRLILIVKNQGHQAKCCASKAGHENQEIQWLYRRVHICKEIW